MQLFSKENVSFFGYFYVLRYSLCKSKVVCEFFLENLQIRKKCSIFVRFFRACCGEHRQKSVKITL